MAEPIVRTFEIDTAKSEQNLRQLGNAFDSADNSGKSLKAQLRELQAQLANTDPQTKKYQELSAAAGELKDKIQDAAQAVGTQAGGAFEKVSGSLGLVTSRIASLDFEGAAEGAKLLAKNISEVKPADIAKGVQGIGSAFVSVGKALLTNPIFLIGAAIAAAVVYADELLTLVDGVTDAELERLNAQKESAAQSKEQLDAISQQENILRLAGKTEREILQTKIAQAQQAIIDQKAVIETLRVQKDQQNAAAERNRDILKGLLNFISIPFTALLAGVDLLTEKLFSLGFISEETFAKFGNLRDKFTTTVAELVFDPAQVAKEGEDALKAAEKGLKDLENAQAGFQLSIQAMDKKAADDRKNAADKQAADAKTKRDQDAKEYADSEKAKTDALELEIKKREQATQTYYEKLAALQDANFEATLTEQEKEELALTQKYEDLFAAADAAGIGTKELQEQLGLELLGIQQKYDAASVDQTEVTEEQKQALQLETVQKGLDYAAQGIQALTNLSDIYFAGRLASAKKGSKEEEALAKKQFAINKKLQFAGAVIDAGKAILTSLANSPVAIGPVPNPIGIASLAFVSLASAANLAKIASTKFEGGSTAPDTPLPSLGGGGGGGDNGAQPAQFNPLAAQFVNNRPDQYLPRAYVLAGDVASQQEVRENVEDLARIG
jgi:hypothetical protein